MDIYSIFFTQLLFGILAILITYTIGKFITSFFSITGGFFFQLFVTYIIGITSIVLFYSIIKTQGKTINILLIPTIAFLLYHYKSFFTKTPTVQLKEVLNEILWSTIPFVIDFAYQSWFYFDFVIGTIKPLFIDTISYGLFSDALNLWGIEGRSIDMTYFFGEMGGLNPYHYAELWFTAFFSFIFKNSSANTYHFITFSTLICTSIVGIASLLEKSSLTFNKYIIIILSIPCLFILGNNNWIIVNYFGQKMSFIYVFFLLSMFLFKEDKWLVGYIIIAIIPVFSITLLPSIYGGLLIFLLFKLIITRFKYFKESLILFSFIFCNIFLIGLFYYTNSSSLNSSHGSLIAHSNVFKGVSGSFSFYNCKIVIANILYYTIPNSLKFLTNVFYFSYLFGILLFTSFKKYLLLFFLIFCFLFMGTIATQINAQMFDAGQFYDSISVILGIFIIVLLSNSLSIKNIDNYIFIGIVYGFMIIVIPTTIQTNNILKMNNDIAFVQKASKLITKDQTVILSFISPDIYLSELNFSKIKSYIVTGMANDIIELTQFTNKKIIFSIGNPESQFTKEKLSLEDSLLVYKNTPINVWRSKGKNYNLQTFVEHYKIKYFYFKDSVSIPSFIAQNIDTIIESPLTHSKFIRIK